MSSLGSAVDNPQPLVTFDNVTLTRSGKPLLDQLSLEITAGQQWVVLGPNGAGKTTFARLLAGRDYLDSGTIRIFGQLLGDHAVVDLASRVGFASAEVGQRFSPVESTLSVVLSAAWGQSVHYQEEYEAADKRRAADLLVALGMGALAEQAFATLSEGERRRVLLARALMADPELVILDEPTAGLDLGGREILVTALTEIMRGPAGPNVILITHELEEIGPDFTHALLLNEGRVDSSGPIEQVLTNENLSRVFGIDVEVNRDNGRWRAMAIARP